MTFSSACLALTQRFEGCRLAAYRDEGGVLTIGWGHTGADVVELAVWTQEQADLALLRDVTTAAAGVNAALKVSVSQDQFDALTDFAFNEGVGALAGSTLMRMLNAGNVGGAVAQFLVWDKVESEGSLVVDAGLLARRQAEQAMFLGVMTT